MANHVPTSALFRVFSGEAREAEAESLVSHLPGCRQCWERSARVVTRLRRESRLKPVSALASAAVGLLDGERVQALRRLKALGWWAELRHLDSQDQLKRVHASPALQSLEMFSVLVAEAADDDRERSFADTSVQVLKGWARAVADAGVRRVIWVTDEDPPETAVSEVVTVSPNDPALSSRVMALDEVSTLSGEDDYSTS